MYTKYLLGFCLLVLCQCCFGQQDVKVFHEAKTYGFAIYASNEAFCPVTVIIDFKLENLRFSGKQTNEFVVPARTKKFKIGDLKVLDTYNKYKYDMVFNSYYGNAAIKRYDSTYVYDLPYLKGQKFLLVQGYNGLFSHKQQNALDFSMPEGTVITAAREGVVIKVVQNNTENCLREECKKLGNFILIYHQDNTFTEYFHIRFNGSKVMAGDYVNRGDSLGYSGNTGYSSAPHLHFSCVSFPGYNIRQTLQTKFRTGNGTVSEYLKENKNYLKDY